MRLIGSFSQEEESRLFSQFLSTQNIKNSCLKIAQKEGSFFYELWVDVEEDVQVALSYFEEYSQNPLSPKFAIPRKEIDPEIRKARQQRRFFPFVSLTSFLIILCTGFFLLNERQLHQIEEKQGIEPIWSPIFSATLFDNPKAMQQLQSVLEKNHLSFNADLQKQSVTVQQEVHEALFIPVWRGILSYLFSYSKTPPLFEKIREGQVWRFFSPSLIHRDFWHLFFNMCWLWGFGLQIERKLKIPYLCLLILLLGVFSNLVQYLMSGPYFLGFSGVVVGLGAFIWSRQKKAPWEGYHLQKGVILFLMLGVLGMCLLDIISLVLQFFGFFPFVIQIANSAHISGGLLGFALGKTNLFARRVL